MKEKSSIFKNVIFLKTLVLSGVYLCFPIMVMGETIADPAQEPAVQVVAKAMPAVVNINTERVIRRRVEDPFEAMINRFYGRITPGREVQQRVQSLGTGFLIDSTGYIVTNSHVVQRAADLKIRVTLSDGRNFAARYIAGDEEADIALIQIESENEKFPFISLDHLSENHLGQTVLALGNPLGYESTVTRGILSAKERDIQIDGNTFKDLLQTDVAINPGNSGGPLLDLSGRLVGVNSIKMAFTPEGLPTQGIGFAIPAQRVRTIVEKLKSAPAPRAIAVSPLLGKFGIQGQAMTMELASALGYPFAGGVVITNVEPNSPAARANLQRGMVIYRVAGQDVGSIEEINTLLQEVSSDSSIEFLIGKEIIQQGNSLRTVVETVTLQPQ